MQGDTYLPLIVESWAGRAELIIDGTIPLATLAAPLLAATGLAEAALAEATGAASRPAEQGCVFWEGQRRLDSGRTLLELGVVAGSELRLT